MVEMMYGRRDRKCRTRRWNSLECLTKTLSNMRDTMHMMVAEMDRTDDTVLYVSQRLKGQEELLRELHQSISNIEPSSSDSLAAAKEASVFLTSPTSLIPYATDPPTSVSKISSKLQPNSPVHSYLGPISRFSSCKRRNVLPVGVSCMQSSYLIYSPSTSHIPTIRQGICKSTLSQPLIRLTSVSYTAIPIESPNTEEYNKTLKNIKDYSQSCAKLLGTEESSRGSSSSDTYALCSSNTEISGKSPTVCSSSISYSVTPTSTSSTSSFKSFSSSFCTLSRCHFASSISQSDSGSSSSESPNSSVTSSETHSVTVTQDLTTAPPPTPESTVSRRIHESLVKAVDSGKIDSVAEILEDGVDVNIISAGRTPLHRAVAKSNPGLVALLLKHGAELEVRDCYGRTPLHIAAYRDDYGLCVTLLLDAGANISSRSCVGLTPLHYAAKCGNEAAVRKLIAAGASNTCKDYKGRTPFDMAKTLCAHRLLRQGTPKVITPPKINNSKLSKYAPVSSRFDDISNGYKRKKS